ncbi:MAG TPA: hypothetical protein DCR97_08330 [Deltaproteobacteria bacterium]|nr:hypothetical protein [Deltaproteobacteria bacterium]
MYSATTRRSGTLSAILVLIALLFASTASIAQETVRSEEFLAKKLQNPLTNFQFLGLRSQPGLASPTGRYGSHQSLLPLQSMVPPSVNTGLNVISGAYTKKKLPYRSGLEGLSVSALVAPADGPTITWGLGPTLSFQGTNGLTGKDRWVTGASGAVVYSVKAWVGGVFVSNTWSFEGDPDDRDGFNRMIVQPFLNYNLSKGWYLTSAPAISVNWQTNGNNAFTVPIGGGVGKVVSVYGQMLNIAAQGYVYPVNPTSSGSGWAVQTTLQWLFPK